MTNRPTDGDRKPQAEKPDLAGFADFNRRDSYSIPAINADAGAGSPRVQHRVSKRQLVEISSRLSGRDLEVLHSVQRHRYLLSTQVQRLHFTEATTSTAALRATNRNLKKLKELGLIDSLARRIGGVRAGSSGLVVHITHAGERLLRLHDHRAYPARHSFDPSPYFLAHTLAVAEVSIQLMEICREHTLELNALELEPECWRSYSGYGTMLSLKPDLYAKITSSEFEDCYFFEIDLATESPSKVAEKCKKYHEYYRSNIEQQESGVFPITVWIVPDDARKKSLLLHIREEFKGQPKLFAVITSSELETLISFGGDKDTLC